MCCWLTSPSLQQVRDVILGLEYLHDADLIKEKPCVYHGDLHPVSNLRITGIRRNG
jgi:hypothetical protein